MCNKNMEKVPKEYWELRIKLACMFIYYPVIWITQLYSVFSPFVRRHLLSYELDGNKKSTFLINLISVTSIAALISLIWHAELLSDPTKYKYILGLYICMIVFGYMSLVFMRDLKMQSCT